jgi:RNA polymerase sigma-70 factor (ECF subfamily)
MQASPDVVEIENAVVRNASCAAPVACPDDGLSAFLGARPRLFGIAYRMLGSAAAAEDIVQDVWIRWQTTDRRSICNPLAFLVTATTRLAINVRQSARWRRESNAEPSMPEPVDTRADPELGAERGEGLAAGLLLLLEKLSPAERVAYILREAFDYTYRDIANVLRLEEANARQVMTRARQRIVDGRALPANVIEQRRLFEAFIAAAHSGDVASLEGTLCGGCRAVSIRQRVPTARPRPVGSHERCRPAAA